jgi:hypothetical protein
MKRKPSCLISCTHGGPDGTAGPRVGRQGSTKPSGWRGGVEEERQSMGGVNSCRTDKRRVCGTTYPCRGRRFPRAFGVVSEFAAFPLGPDHSHPPKAPRAWPHKQGPSPSPVCARFLFGEGLFTRRTFVVATPCQDQRLGFLSPFSAISRGHWDELGT